MVNKNFKGVLAPLAGLLLVLFFATPILALKIAVEPLFVTVWKLDAKAKIMATTIMRDRALLSAETLNAEQQEKIIAFIAEYKSLHSGLYKILQRVHPLLVETIKRDKKNPFGRPDLTNSELTQLLAGGVAALILYENLWLGNHLSDTHPTIKSMVETHDPAFAKAIYDNWFSPKNRKNYRILDGVLKKYRKQVCEEEQNREYFILNELWCRRDTELHKEIVQSASFFNSIYNKIYMKASSGKLKFLTKLNQFEYTASKVFGNIAGAANVQSYMAFIPKEALAKIQTTLEPGDIIVEKTRGALTDKFIPGFFGHAALVVGRPDQLSDLTLEDGTPLLDHPLFQKYRGQLESGHVIVESVRPGVKLAKLEEWYVSDLAVLRMKDYPREKLGEVLLKGIGYTGSAYDFNFDVHTPAIVSCAELVFQSYKGVHFATTAKAGRKTINPDQIAYIAGLEDNRPADCVYFYFEGRELAREECLPTLLNQFNQDEYQNSAEPEL